MPAWVYALLASVALIALLALPGVAEAVGRAASMLAPLPLTPAGRPPEPRAAAARAEYLALVRRTRELERRHRRRKAW